MGIKDLRKDIHFSELLSGSSVAFMMRIAGMLAGYVFTFLVARRFGADVMGVFTLSITVLSIASVLGRLGLDTALLRFIAEYTSQGSFGKVTNVYRKSVTIVLSVSVLVSVILFFSAPYLAQYALRKAHIAGSIKIVSIAIVPSVLIFINTQALRALKKIMEYSFFQNVSNYLFASFFIILLMLVSDSDVVPLIAYILALFAGLILSMVFWRKSRREVANDKEVIKAGQLLRVSIPMLLSNSMFLLMGWVTILILGYFRPESDVGIFNVAFKIASLTSIALVSTNAIMGPKIAEFYGKKDFAGMSRSARQSTGLVFWVTLPLACILFIFPGQVMGFFGEEFRTGALILIILASGQFINASAGPVGLLLQMTGKQVLLQNIMVGVTIINVVLNIMLIPRYGIIGAAISTMICTVLLNGIPFIYIRYCYGFYTISPSSLLFIRND